MAPRYLHLAINVKNNLRIDLVPFTSVTFSEVKNGSGDFTGTTPLTMVSQPDTTGRNKINRSTLGTGAARKIVTLRDGVPVSEKLLWNVAMSDVQSNALAWTGGGGFSYAAHRRIKTDLSYDQDQFQTFRDLIAHMQAASVGDIGLTVSGPASSGVTRELDIVGTERRFYSAVLEDLRSGDDGFEFRERVLGDEETGFNTDIVLATSFTNSATGASIQLGRNAKALAYTENGSITQTNADVIGQSKTGAKFQVGSAANAASLNARPQLDGYQRMEIAPGQGNAVLSARAREIVAAYGRPVKSLTVELAPDDATANYGNTGIGSVIPVTADYSWLQLNKLPFEVQGRSISVTDTGEETISLQMSSVS